MRSSIFSSERDVIKVIVFFLLVMSTYFFINFAGFKLTTNHSHPDNSYENDVSGKNELMKKFYAHGKPDIVLVGSSTTKYHVSTNLFKSAKIQMFNYGLESHFFTAYPTMIDNAIKAKPKVIALSIDSPELYYPLLSVEAAFNHGINITFDNLLFFTNHYMHHLNNSIEVQLILRMLKIYIQQLNYFFMNGHQFTDYIQTTYNRFNPAVATKKSTEEDKAIDIDKKYIDCEPIGGIAKAGFGCTNGDGVLIGYEKNIPYENFNKKTEYANERYNYVFVSILNDMLDKIRKANIIPVIIFIPQFEYSITNTDLIKNTIHADIIDMTQFRVPKNAWYNGGHFNEKGRYIYSSALAKRIKPLIRKA